MCSFLKLHEVYIIFKQPKMLGSCNFGKLHHRIQKSRENYYLTSYLHSYLGSLHQNYTNFTRTLHDLFSWCNHTCKQENVISCIMLSSTVICIHETESAVDTHTFVCRLRVHALKDVNWPTAHRPTRLCRLTRGRTPNPKSKPHTVYESVRQFRPLEYFYYHEWSNKARCCPHFRLRKFESVSLDQRPPHILDVLTAARPAILDHSVILHRRSQNNFHVTVWWERALTRQDPALHPWPKLVARLHIAPPSFPPQQVWIHSRIQRPGASD